MGFFSHLFYPWGFVGAAVASYNLGRASSM